MSQRYSFFDGEVTVTATAPWSLWLESEHITKLVWDEVNPIPEEGLALLSFAATVYSAAPQ